MADDALTPRRRIGLLGGTFDPIHMGHLAMAEAVRCEYALDKVIFIPAQEPPNKPGVRVASPQDRLRMVESATQSNPYFAVSDIEMRRPGPSYTIDTIYQWRRLHPADTLFFLMGTDVVLDMVTWERIEELLGMCEFVAAQRPGGGDTDWSAAMARFGDVGRHIHPLATPELQISSTDIRARLRRGFSIRYIVPEAVIAYIDAHGLYRC